MTEMSPAEEIFFAALEIKDVEERLAYLKRVSADRPELLIRVKKLLAAQPDVGQFLDGQATEAFQLKEDVPESSTIGPYKLLQKLGEGGMGTVWVAEQEQPVKRRVALKLIKAGMDSAQVIRRFEAERQALALMDHTNIAKVLDAGTTEQGRPYFVMELVKGVPITKYCDEVHASIENRLDLFVQVCSAVQHAHQKGIIHRDIKPSNVLIAMQDGKPVPKVIDFGVAKALHSKLADQTMYTEIGQIIGTLEYMAPEQAELSAMDIDTRADIYALGVLLYELLTGSTPITRERMKSAAFAEVLRLIKEEDPPKPSTRLSESKESLASVASLRRTDPKHLSSELRGELDWVVLKALEKDRTRRYETANGLARDIQRYLADEVVEARPPSARYRLRKLVRRNRGQVIAGSLVLSALLTGIAGTTWGLFRAERSAEAERLAKVEAQSDREAAVNAAEAERRAKLDAEKNLKQATENLAFARKANDILGSVFVGLDPKANYATVAELRNALKDNLTKAVKELDGTAIGDPLVVAEIQNKLGQSLLGLGDAILAIDVLSKSLATFKERLGADHPTTLAAMGNLAEGYHTAGKMDKALPLLEETLKRKTARLGADHPSTLTAMGNLASGYKAVGKMDKALPLLEETLKRRAATLGADHLDTLHSMTALAVAYSDAGKPALALPLSEETVKLMRIKQGADHPSTLLAMNNLTSCYMAAAKVDKALLLQEQVLKLIAARLGADHPKTLTAMSNLAVCYQDSGKMDKALPLMVETLKLRTAKLGADHPETLDSMAILAIVYQNAGKLDLALPLCEESLKLMRIKLGPDHPKTLRIMSILAMCYRQVRQYERAELLHRERLSLVKQKSGETSSEYASELAFLAWNQLQQKKWTDAETFLRECLTIREKTQPDVWSTFNIQSMLGEALMGQKKYAEAEPLLLKGYEGMKQREKTIPANGVDNIPRALDRLIQLYSETNKPDEVKKWQAEKDKLTKAVEKKN